MSAATLRAARWHVIPDDGGPGSATVCGWVGSDDEDPCETSAAYSVRLGRMHPRDPLWAALCLKHAHLARLHWPDVQRVRDVRDDAEVLA